MDKRSLKSAVRVILPLWLIVRIIAGLVTFCTLGAIDLTYFNPSVETAFQMFIFFIKNTTTGLAVFISVISLTVLGAALGFFVSSDSRKLRMIGFFAYALLFLLNIISALVLVFQDGIFILSLVMELLIGACLIYFSKTCLFHTKNTADRADGSDGSHRKFPK